MKIKQVEELVGITKKNIRFYESQGLLDVERAENGYREYHKEDIARLQEIKLFRKMDLSIEEMKALFEKKKSLQICLEQHLKELEYRKEVEQMEKEGAKFMNVNKMDVHKKKRKGAIIGAVVMTVLMALTIGFMLWGNSQDPIPLGLLVFLIAIPAALIIGLWIALAGRMKEIEGGEEDEASKY